MQIVISKDDGDGADVTVRSGSPVGDIEFEVATVAANGEGLVFCLTNQGAKKLVQALTGWIR